MNPCTDAVEIRVATPGDASALAHLHAGSWRQAYRGQLSDAYLAGPIEADRLALWSGRLRMPEPGQAIWVATQQGQVVGLACAFARHDPRWGALLENLHVAPAHKRQGIGRRLLAEVQAWAAQPGVISFNASNDSNSSTGAMHLWVLAANADAQRFYLRHGARHVDSGEWLAPDGSCLAQWCYAWP